MLRMLGSVEATDLLKDQSYRMRAAAAILEGLDQLEKALWGVLFERDGR